MDETKKVGNIILTIVVLLALSFGIYYLVSNNKPDTYGNVQNVLGSDYYVSVVQMKHQFKDGRHTYVGSLDLPTPCYSLDSDLVKTSNTEGSITLNTSRNDEEICAQVVTTRTFRLQIDAPMNFMVKGMLNGRAVELNMFEVPASDDIDLFEINIKG
jgi:hypothetical protein